MKKSFLFIAFLTLSFIGSFAQDSKGSFSVGTDLYSNYVWRGLELSNNPVVQPSIGYSKGGFSIGAWGSYSLSADKSGTEADLYLGYNFEKLGLSFTFTDYFFPGSSFDSETGDYITNEYFDYENQHTFELMASKTLGNLYLTACYYLQNPIEGFDNDLYLEAGYSFGTFSVFVGGGDETYTTDGDFAINNIGISTSKEIAITEKFSLPMSGSVILNPDTEQIFFVVGVSF